MANGTHPSDRKLKAAEAQSLADRTGTNKEQASKLQGEADLRDLKKH